jgi:hypothetical protein
MPSKFEQIRAELAERNPAALLADGFDTALVGFTANQHHPVVAVYDLVAWIDILGTRDQMSEEEAEEYLEFNTLGAYVGEHGPLFVLQRQWEDEDVEYGAGLPTSIDNILGCRLLCTCPACPEQYEVIDNATGAEIGYLRLRHGYFRADYPNVRGETVYDSQPKGDGIFDDDERLPELTKAVEALLARHRDTTPEAP